MTGQKLEVGNVVIHPKKAQWGPGKVLEIGGGGKVTIYLRDLKETKPGESIKTISTSVVGLALTADLAVIYG